MVYHSVKDVARQALQGRVPDQRLGHAAVVVAPGAHGHGAGARLGVSGVVVWARDHHGTVVLLLQVAALLLEVLLAAVFETRVNGCGCGHDRQPSSGVRSGWAGEGVGVCLESLPSDNQIRLLL